MVRKEKTQHRRKSPKRELRTFSGMYRKIDQKTCTGCGELRNAVDESGLCGYCRALLIISR